MKRFHAVTAALLVLAFTAAGCAHMADDGWVTLIDGPKGLENWNRVGDANWRGQRDYIVADQGKGGHLVSKKSYKDFILRAEFWAGDTTNSGIFIRASDPKKIGARDQHLRPASRSGICNRRHRRLRHGAARPLQGRGQVEHVRDYGHRF